MQPLADYLARRSGHAVQVRILPSPTALVEALRHAKDLAAVQVSKNLREVLAQGSLSEGLCQVCTMASLTLNFPLRGLQSLQFRCWEHV